MPSKRKEWLYRWAFAINSIGVMWLAIIPAANLSSLEINIWDKLQHALAFVWLTFLGIQSFPQSAFNVLLGLFIFGAAIEFIQGASGWRQGDWLDLVADTVGILTAYGFIRLWALI